MEEFECLLGESPTNYPKGEGVENMESELHSAAIDTDVYEKEIAERAAHENECSLQVETTNKVFKTDTLDIHSPSYFKVLYFVFLCKL